MTARQECLAFGRVEVPVEAIEPGLWENSAAIDIARAFDASEPT
ncbi:hypothetical protein [Streptomyces puniciscabiei]